jgi:hypothetical protein
MHDLEVAAWHAVNAWRIGGLMYFMKQYFPNVM